MDYARPERADALAAEYVAGTLRGPARRRLESLLPGHPRLRAAVHEWQERLLPFTDALPPVPPPPEVWAAVERRLWPAAPPSRAASALAWWRGVAVLAGAATLALGLRLALPPSGEPPLLVVLQPTGAEPALQPALVASIDADRGTVALRPVSAVAVQPGRALELWAVPAQGAPRSLGLVAGHGVTVVPGERWREARRRGDVSALAVSVEPPGGSPSGAPSGPIVYLGRLGA